MSKLVMAFVSVIIGIALLSQLAIVGLAVTTTTDTTETLNIIAARTNSTYIENQTIHLINNLTNESIGSWIGYNDWPAGALYSVDTITATNATDGVAIPAAFVSANFSINLTSGELNHITATSEWNDTDVNFSFSFVVFYVNTTYQIIPTVVSEAATGWRSDSSECADGSIISGTYTNSSGDAYTAATDYTVSTDGYITLLNTDAINRTDNTVMIANNANCADDYLTQGWQRNIINLVPGFFALAILGIGLWLFYSVAKAEGLL